MSTNTPQFPEENLLSTAAQGDGFFITRPGAFLKHGRYKIVRKLGRGRYSTTFLVEDLQWFTESRDRYLAAKILSVDSTTRNALGNGLNCEVEFFQAMVSGWPERWPYPDLPRLYDHFSQNGPHGVHYCLLFGLLGSDLHVFRASAPTGRLAVYVVKPIIASVVDALQVLHLRNIIHADIRSENVLFDEPDTPEIEKIIDTNPPLVDGTFQFNGEEFPILRSQPFLPRFSWDVSPLMSELIGVNLSDLSSALWADRPKPRRDIGLFALRAPENIIRAGCNMEIDIWAIGCMTYELLTGQVLFQPPPSVGLTPDESMLLLQYAFTGETLSKDVIEQSCIKEKYFDKEGVLIKSGSNPYPRQTFRELLSKHCRSSEPVLSEIRIDGAAKFIGDCLRLNPQDRLTVHQLTLHRWLETAFMGCCDHD